MELNTLIISGIFIVLAAGFIQGLTSFGFALISVPFLAKIIPIQEAVPIVVILGFCTNIVVFISSVRHVDMKRIWLLIVSGLAAAPLGTYLLIYLNANVLKLVTGVLIIAFAGLLLLGKSFHVHKDRFAFVPVGIMSGLLNGSISMSGPPVALFLSNQGVSKETFRANLAVYGIFLNVITVGTYIYSGLMTSDVMTYTTWFIPSMLLGVVIGIKAVKRLNDELFRRLSLWLIMISGVWTIVGTLM